MRACVATILGESFDQVPNFWDLEDLDASDYTEAIIQWCKDRGWTRLHCDAEFLTDVVHVFVAPGQLAIAGGRSPRSTAKSPTTHAVVVQWDFSSQKWEIVHDPHPSREGIVGPFTSLSLFIPARPSQSS